MDSQVRLFVGNLPDTLNQKDLHAAFSQFGNISKLDLKSKSGDDSEKKNFAFITLSASGSSVQSCIKHFSEHPFNGSKLYVTQARESFLERLQRERSEIEEAKHLKEKAQEIPHKDPVIRLGDILNPKLRKSLKVIPHVADHKKSEEKNYVNEKVEQEFSHKTQLKEREVDQKKQDADKKRMDAIIQKRQEFKMKQQLIKSGLNKIDQVKNKKLIFTDNEILPESDQISLEKEVSPPKTVSKRKRPLFDDANESDDDIKIDIKQQYEGKSGQKVLELQSRYKSDKRFILDERFIENELEDKDVEDKELEESQTNIDLGSTDEKTKQLNILENVLGVALRKPMSDTANNNKSVKPKTGMLRFDPSQPDHAKFLAPIEVQQEQTNKHKKKKKQKEEKVEQKAEVEPEAPRPEVSKEQFYKISETLKEAIAQPTTFSLRSLFGNNEETKTEEEPSNEYICLAKPKDQKKKVINPLDPGEKNPFIYDSSDSEDETGEVVKPAAAVEVTEVKAVWKENFFFTDSDIRLKEGLAFFNKTDDNEGHKERRELKTLMKKRIYNKERKNQMFQKKIGGRRKSMKKSYNRNEKRNK